MYWKLQRLLKERNIDFRSVDRSLYTAAQANLRRGIREAKSDYRRRIEDHLGSNNSRQVWQGVQHLTNYRTNVGAAEGDTSFAEELNLFFASFKAEQPDTATLHPDSHGRITLTVEECEVRHTLQAVNPRKAAGPDVISGRVLKDCADQLTGDFQPVPLPVHCPTLPEVLYHSHSAQEIPHHQSQ